MFDMSELHAAVSRNVKVLMALRGIRSQRALADLIGMDLDTLNKKMLGRRPFSLDDIDVLAAALGITPSALIGDVQSIIDPANEATGTVSHGRPHGRTSACISHENVIEAAFAQVNGPASSVHRDGIVIPFRLTA